MQLDLTEDSLNAKFEKRASEDPQLVEMRNKLFAEEEKEN
jgi:hypothetical protein